MKRLIVVLLFCGIFTFFISDNIYAYDTELPKLTNNGYEWNIRAYDPVGKTAIVINDYNYGIWDIESNSVIELGIEFDYEDVYYSPDGSKAVLGGSYDAFTTELYVIDINSGKYSVIDFSDLNDDYFDYLQDDIRQYFIDDNTITIFTSNQVYKYDIKNNELSKVSDFKIFGSAKLSPNGKYFLNYTEDLLTIRNASSIKQIKSINLSDIKNENYNYDKNYICFSPNGKYLAVSFENGKTNIYDTEDYNLQYTLDVGGSVSFCNNDSIIIVGSSYAFERDEFKKIYNFKTDGDGFNIFYESFKGFITADGKYLVGYDTSIYDALLITYRLEKIYIKPTEIKIDINSKKGIDLTVVGVYSNGEEKIIDNSKVSFICDSYLSKKLDNGKLGKIHADSVGMGLVKAEYLGFRDSVSVHATESPTGLILYENKLTWKSSSYATAYNVYRSNNKGQYNKTPLNIFPIKSTEFEDNSRVVGQDYYYVVTALYGDDYDDMESAYSNEVNTLKVDYEIKLQIGTPYMYKNNEKLNIDDNGTVPLIKNGRTLLPIRAIIESLGGYIIWNAAESKVEIRLGINEISLKINDEIAYVNGIAKKLDVSPEIINGRTMVPFRFIGENLGCEVEWDSYNNIAILRYSN
ncbi:MAG: stalk domain-containing protein [Vulcanibacillus sp.]